MDTCDFRRVCNVLQPIFSGTIATANATHEVLVLSDSGSTVGFTAKDSGRGTSKLWKRFITVK
jgi:hypothetical protein